MVGRWTRILFSRRRRRAMSNSHGRLLAASKKTLSPLDLIKPSNYIKSSVFILLLASCSPEELRELRIESISSMKMVLGWWKRAISKSSRTNFSESPLHLLTMVEAEMLKNVVLHSVATALASMVLPVPGGPNKRMPFQGSSMPVKRWGYFRGISTASFSSLFASSNPTMSWNLTLGLSFMISLWMVMASSLSSGLYE